MGACGSPSYSTGYTQLYRSPVSATKTDTLHKTFLIEQGTQRRVIIFPIQDAIVKKEKKKKSFKSSKEKIKHLEGGSH